MSFNTFSFLLSAASMLWAGTPEPIDDRAPDGVPADLPELDEISGLRSSIGIINSWGAGDNLNAYVNPLPANFTMASGKIKVQSGNVPMSLNHYTALDRWNNYCEYEVVSYDVNASDKTGLKIGLKCQNPFVLSLGLDDSTWSCILFDNTIFGNNIFPLMLQGNHYQSSTGIEILPGDKLRHTYYKNEGYYCAYVINTRTNDYCYVDSTNLYKKDYPGNNSNTTAFFSILNSGAGEYLILTHQVKSYQLTGGKLAVGDSITWGSYAGRAQTRWANLVGCEVNGGSGDRIQEVLLRMPEILNLCKPQQVFMMIGSNNGDGSTEPYQSIFIDIKNQFAVAGVDFWAIVPPASAVGAAIEPIRNVIYANMPSNRVVDVFTATCVPNYNSLLPTYNGGDGTHLNVRGNEEAVANSVLAAIGQPTIGPYSDVANAIHQFMAYIPEVKYNKKRLEAYRTLFETLYTTGLFAKLNRLYIPRYGDTTTRSVSFVNILEPSRNVLYPNGINSDGGTVKGDGISQYIDFREDYIGFYPIESMGWFYWCLNPIPNEGGYEWGHIGHTDRFNGMQLAAPNNKSVFGVGERIEIDRPADLTGLWSASVITPDSLGRVYRNGVPVADLPGRTGASFGARVTALAFNNRDSNSGFSNNEFKVFGYKSGFTDADEVTFYNAFVTFFDALDQADYEDANPVIVAPPVILPTQAETTTYKQNIIANGGTISDHDLAAVNKFVYRSKQDGYWTKIIDFAPLAGNGIAAALVKLKSGQANYKVMEISGPSVVYNKERGFHKVNDADEQLVIKLTLGNPDTNAYQGVAFMKKQNSEVLVATTQVHPNALFLLSNAQEGLRVDIENTTINSWILPIVAAYKPGNKFIHTSRKNDSFLDLYVNGQSTGNPSTSNDPVTGSHGFPVCGRVNSGTLMCMSTDAGGFTDKQVQKYSENIHNLMTELGREVAPVVSTVMGTGSASHILTLK